MTYLLFFTCRWYDAIANAVATSSSLAAQGIHGAAALTDNNEVAIVGQPSSPTFLTLYLTQQALGSYYGTWLN